MLATGETLIKLNLNINMATMMTSRRVNELTHSHASEYALISMMLYKQAEMMAYSLSY